MEETTHLESPGVNLTASKDKATQYTISKMKKYLENLYGDTEKNLVNSPCRLSVDFLQFLSR